MKMCQNPCLISTEKAHQELADQKALQFTFLWIRLPHSLEIGEKPLGWGKKNPKGKDFCWGKKAHSTTSQFSGQYCEAERSEAKIQEQTFEQL